MPEREYVCYTNDQNKNNLLLGLPVLPPISYQIGLGQPTEQISDCWSKLAATNCHELPVIIRDWFFENQVNSSLLVANGRQISSATSRVKTQTRGTPCWYFGKLIIEEKLFLFSHQMGNGTTGISS